MKTIEEFLATGGCPCCGENLQLDYGDINIDSNTADQKAECHTCGFGWYEIYEIQGFEFKTYQGEPVYVGKEV